MKSEYFESLCQDLFKQLNGDEAATVSLTAEDSEFVRLNHAKVRQTGLVQDAKFAVKYYNRQNSNSSGHTRELECAFSLTGNREVDGEGLKNRLAFCRKEIQGLPVQPFSQWPVASVGAATASSRSVTEKKGQLLPRGKVVETLIKTDKDLTGIYQAGQQVRAAASSAGLYHFFSNENYNFDFSLIHPNERAVKCEVAGTAFDVSAYEKELERAEKQLELLAKPGKKLAKGDYRVFMAPSAVAELVHMFSWGAVSEAAMRQGECALRKLKEGTESFSPKFSLIEDFRQVEVPRFNSQGELAPESLPLILEGKLQNLWRSARTAKEYGVVANGAVDGEGLRAPVVGAGSLSIDDAYRDLGTGVYLSNLHYLNWSDQVAARVTGLTRYACLWVENGVPVCPIETMRWDDTLFRLLGSELLDFTKEQSMNPTSQSYEFRAVGGLKAPGALIRSMHFTL